MEVHTKSAKETKELGKNILSKLSSKQKPLVLALSGELGSGKTTFVQGLAEGLGIKQRIVSPTFIIMRQYSIPRFKDHDSQISDLYHIDLYRLEENIDGEMKNLGMDEIFSDSENIVIIEWAEKGKNTVPKDAIWVKFENLGGDKRKIVI